jgi:hypothetical protein
VSGAVHTPGPWFVVPYGDGDSLVICPDQGGEWRICFMATHGGTPSVWQAIQANARLIAAAPELVEALSELSDAEASYRKAHDLYGGGDIRTGRAWDRLRRAGDKARAALHKAGVTP